MSSGWYTATDPVSGTLYYYNGEGETTWEKPGELGPISTGLVSTGLDGIGLKTDTLNNLVSKLDFLNELKDSKKDATFNPVSPTYKPTSPTYDPTSPTSPTYNPTSPTYDPTYNPTYNPTSPTYDPTYNPTSPTYNPTYNPTSPTYNPTSPTYNPSYNPTLLSTKISWGDESFNEEEKKKVREKAKDKDKDIEDGEIKTIDPMHLPYTSAPMKPHYHTEPPPFTPSTLTRPEHPLKRVFGILNWTKAILIRAVLGIWGEDASVLVGCELGCGNGRDASKWGYALKDTRQSMHQMVLVDYRERVLLQAVENFKKEFQEKNKDKEQNKDKETKITKIDHDLTSMRLTEEADVTLSNNINSAVAFHLLQFIWSSEDAARTAIYHISNMLIPGGPVVFMYTDSGQVLARLRQTEWDNPGTPMEQRTLDYVTKLFTLSCTSSQLRKFEERDTSPYGHRIKLVMAGGPPSNEFLVSSASLLEVLKDNKLSTLLDMPMHAFLHKLVKSEQNAELGRKMRMFGETQSLDSNEWETLSLYRVTVAVHGTKPEAVNAAKCWMRNRLFGSDN